MSNLVFIICLNTKKLIIILEVIIVLIIILASKAPQTKDVNRKTQKCERAKKMQMNYKRGKATLKQVP